MKKLIISLLIILLTGCNQVNNSTSSESKNDDYITIDSKEKLEMISSALNGSYRLTKDIVLDEWLPIGTANAPFTGYFDGNGYQIKNMKITNELLPQEELEDVNIYGGLFGYNAGVITNLNLVDFSINCNVSFQHEKEVKTYLGGIAGKNSGLITNTYASGSIEGSSSVGKLRIGLISGKNVHEIINCSSKGFIKGTVNDDNARLGGIAGEINSKSGKIEKSWTDSEIIGISINDGNIYAGGITGVLESGNIINCYSIGNIDLEGKGKSKEYAGGITGYIGHSEVFNDTLINFTYSLMNLKCYSGTLSNNSSNQSYAGGITGAFYQAINNSKAVSIIIANSFYIGTMNVILKNKGSKGSGMMYGLNANGQISLINCYPEISIEDVTKVWDHNVWEFNKEFPILKAKNPL